MPRSSASLPDAHRFVAAVQRAQGRVPEPITALLDAADVLMAPRPVQNIVSAIIDELVSGKASAAKLDELLDRGRPTAGHRRRSAVTSPVAPNR